MKEPRFYIIEGRTVRPCDDLEQWAIAMESPDRLVARTAIADFAVSTVFLGLDHSFGHGPVQLFETMVFDAGGEGQGVWRCSTYAQAIEQHAKVCESGVKLEAKANEDATDTLARIIVAARQSLKNQ